MAEIDFKSKQKPQIWTIYKMLKKCREEKNNETL